MRSIGWVASLIAVTAFACGYDFGGGAGGSDTTGTATAASGSTGSFATVAANTSATTVASASGSGATSVVVGSSSTGVVEPMGRCLDTLGNVFFNDFSTGDDPAWTPIASGLTAVARVEQGVARLVLGDQSKVSLQSVQLIAFTECGIEANLVEPSQHFDSILLAHDALNYVGAFTYQNQWALDARAASVGVPASVTVVPFAPWVRLRAQGASVYFETSPDGTTYTIASEWSRAALPFLDSTLNLAFTLQREASGGVDDEARWDSLNTMP